MAYSMITWTFKICESIVILNKRWRGKEKYFFTEEYPLINRWGMIKWETPNVVYSDKDHQ